MGQVVIYSEFIRTTRICNPLSMIEWSTSAYRPGRLAVAHGRLNYMLHSLASQHLRHAHVIRNTQYIYLGVIRIISIDCRDYSSNPSSFRGKVLHGKYGFDRGWRRVPRQTCNPSDQTKQMELLQVFDEAPCAGWDECEGSYMISALPIPS